jgi:hypothetical protein
MHTTEEADEQCYRDTESIAFPALSDEQVATLVSLGARRKVMCMMALEMGSRMGRAFSTISRKPPK